MDLLSRTSCLPARIYLLVCILTRSFISLTVLLLALLKVGIMLKLQSPEAKQLLGKFYAEFPAVFKKPMFPPHDPPIKHPIVLKPGCDVPPKRQLYPLAGDKLQKLKT